MPNTQDRLIKEIKQLKVIQLYELGLGNMTKAQAFMVGQMNLMARIDKIIDRITREE